MGSQGGGLKLGGAIKIASAYFSRIASRVKELWNRAVIWMPPWGPATDLDIAELKGAEALPRLRRALRRPFVAVLLFSLAMNFLALTLPVYMSQIYDRVLTSYSIETLVMLTLLAAGLLRLFVALDGIRTTIISRVALKAEQSLAPALLVASVRDQLAGRSDAAMPMRDLTALRTFAMSPVVTGLFDAPLVPLYVVVTFLVHPILGALTLLGACAMLALAVANQAATAQRLTRAGRASNALLFAADSQIRNADAIVAMGLLPALIERWRKSQNAVIADQLAANDSGRTYQSTTRYLRLVMQVIVLGTGAALVVAGKMTPGMMFAASIILSRGLQPIEIAVGSWRTLLSAKENYRRIDQALKRTPAEPERMALPAPQGRLDVEKVNWFADEQRPVLRDISFTLAPGDMLGLIGPAASGKSTLARLILGVLQPSSGKVRLDGADLSQWPHDALGSHFGYLPQGVELFPGTIAENIARMNKPVADDVIAAARWAGVHELILRMPHGYDTKIMSGGMILTPGQRQRIALARALYGSPKLIVLDEPNSNLDGDGEQALVSALEQARQRGITTIVIAHRLAILVHANKALLLRDGAVHLFGPYEEVLARISSKPTQIQPPKIMPLVNPATRPAGGS